MDLLHRNEKIFLIVVYGISLLSCFLASLLPYWISTTIGLGSHAVKVTKDLNSGLFFMYENLLYYPGSSVEAKKGMKGVIGTSLYTNGVKSVTGLMMTALSLLVFGFIYNIITILFRSNCTAHWDKKVQLVVMAVMPFIAAVLMAVGVGVFYKEVLDEYELSEDKKHVGASFWLAVMSSVGSFLTGGWEFASNCFAEKTGRKKKTV